MAGLAGLTTLAIQFDPVSRASLGAQAVLLLPVGILALSAAWRSGPYHLRAVIFVAAALAAEVGFLVRVGFTAAPALAGLTAVVVAGLLLGVRVALGAWVVSALTLLSGGLAIKHGWLVSTFDPVLLDPTNAALGIRYGLSYATFSAFMAIGVTVLVERLSASLREVQEAHDTKQENHAQWQSVMENATDQIVILDREHRIEFRNRDLLGTREEDVLGVPIEQLLPEAHREAAWRGIEGVFETAENMMYDSVVTDPSGARRFFSARVSPVYQDGRVDRVTVISTDLTERHLLEDQLRHAQKMDAVGQLAGGVAHDFNNLLTVIVGYASDLLERVKDDEAVIQDLSSIQEAAVRGAALTGQLLAFSRQQPSDPHSLSIDATIRGMESMLSRLLGEEIEFVMDLEPRLGFARADRSQIEQVLANLVVNARDAMPDGGMLRVVTRNRVLGAEEAGRAGLPPGHYVSFVVSDEGIGMSREVREKIFDPFFTTKEVGRGTGLGLSTAYGIVQEAAGAICVTTRAGEGSQFEVLLPLAAPEEIAQGAGHEIGAGPASDVRTVLVVEDEEAVRGLLARVLRKAGYEVVEANDGAHALSVLADAEGGIDAILTDVRMPRMSGPALAKEVRRGSPALPIVFMTGYPADPEISGTDVTTIPKPFSPDELIARLRDIFG